MVEHVVGPEQAEARGAAGVQHERGQAEAGGGLLRGGEGGVEDQARQPGLGPSKAMCRVSSCTGPPKTEGPQIDSVKAYSTSSIRTVGQ